MEPADSEPDGREAPSALARRACDQCRLRKIRCDKRSPCSNCRSSNIVCRSTGEGQKPHEPRRRVLISSQYEKKVDLIEERLGGMEQALRELLATSRQQAGPPTTKLHRSSQALPRRNPPLQPAAKNDPSNPREPSYRSNAAIEQHDSNSGFEGGSSLSAHSAYAREFLESAVSHGTPEMLSSPKISEALSSLKQIVEMQNKKREADINKGPAYRHDSRLGMRCDIRDLEMPPLPVVLSIIREAKENPPSSFSGWIPFFTIDYFIEKCQEVYFCTDYSYSDTTFIITNFGLYSIFIEYHIIAKEQATRDEYQHYMHLCKENLETALANLNILMPANFDSVAALALGSLHGIEISKPSVGWTLASMAIHMCQTLGYHRLSSMEHESEEVKQKRQSLFWTVYTLLNILSLRLGRGTVIQDYDIALPSPTESIANSGPWATVCGLWAKQSMIQVQVYTMLYSPAALNRSESERVSHARRLAAEMQTSVVEPFDCILSSGERRLSDVDLIYLQSDKVSRMATLTLIYRAIPAGPNSTTTFIPECIESARAALEIHQTCVSSLKETSEMIRISYMHWAVFLSPFVPFIVIFCHVIVTSDQKDLTRLEDFIASLRPLCPFSQSVDRLHSLCSVLGTVARLYVEAKSRTQTGEDQTLASVGEEFDVYLSALGLAPGNMAPGNMVPNGQTYLQPDVPPMQMGVSEPPLGTPGFSAPTPQPQPQEGMSMAEMSQATQLGNWFSGNQYMMGLLEEDMFHFNPNA
ncbi:transcriptional regulator family: Fungal Specific TF [Penicillium argentinense]|uniref:Transcriptional regulator family: Fungal Specific TF n=1 Tax=Penicillium argentinense TaxID=1131581 RepID=A0A9W9FGH4_9EURO|nr:transcriptional regulator family: Fungal Specific TF [Penicillium argentinense]KAJ5099699.1 transcriptional regulator family: Fungal Specific TF [Penicillium argentinense]